MSALRGFWSSCVRWAREFSRITPYRAAWLLFAAFFLAVPFVPLLKARLFFFMLMLEWIAMAESFNIISGFTGYVCFGFPAFYGVGAVLMAWAVGELGLHPAVGFLMAVGGAILMAFVMGGPSLRLRGAYFAICSLAICLAMSVIMAWLKPFGIFIPPNPKIFRLVEKICYYIVAFTAFGTVLGTYILSKSKLGLALVAIREDEDAAETRGVNTTFYKLVAVIISGIPPAIIGAAIAWYSTYVDCVAVFELHRVVATIAMAMLGGSGTVLGPLIGAIILYAVEDFLWANFPYLYLPIFGAIIVITVLFVPQGIVGMVREKVPKARKYLF